MTCTRHLSPWVMSPIVCIKISEIRSPCSVAASQKNKNISESCCFKHTNITVWHAGSLVPELTWCCSSPQARAEPPPQSEVHLYDHIHTSGNRVPTETQQRGTAQHFIVKRFFFGVSAVWFWFKCGFRCRSLNSDYVALLAFLSPDIFFFNPVSGLPLPPSLYFLSPLSRLCPPCRSVNTSGWASMTTGHQLFQISENHRKWRSFFRKNMKRKDGNKLCIFFFSSCDDFWQK